MQVKEITLTTSPTVVIGGDYIKAGASVTVLVADEDNLSDEIEQTTEILKSAYRHALLAEIQAVTAVSKRETRVRIVKWLRRIINGKEA